MTRLVELTISEALNKLDAGEITSVELTQAHLDQINTLDHTIKAFITVTPELALEQARQADELRAQGIKKPLLGIPLAIKDVLSTKGVETTCASKILKGYVPLFDATCVARLYEAGMVMLGKLNMDEFAMGSSTENSAFFNTLNPWDLERVPGGSSGGSGAAVAALMCMGALGTDTGGSIRLPGSFCGITALKPSYGRVSRYGLIAYGSSLDCAGPMTRTVEDAARLLQVMAGHDPLDSTSMPDPVPDYLAALTGDIRGLKIGIPKEYFVEGMQPEVESAVRVAIDKLQELGAQIVEISLPHTEYSLPVYYLVATSEASANLARFDGIRYGSPVQGEDMWDTYRKTRGQGFGDEVKRRIMLGTYALSAGYYDAFYGKATQVRALIKRDFEQAFQTVDLIVAPTSPSVAFKLGENVADPLQMYLADVLTIAVNLGGVCGISVPCGFGMGNMPIGLQLIGPALGEDVLLRAAHAYQTATEWHKSLPPLVQV
ncbi:MAG: Asp-tRNA(Asn)/Glu-tRNA(Gln) amidotransferase GatCAB subunit A [Phototrophicales bacterium]|nr:MAG: Asp-tRNA(Asn)/Glu-tRNA(Gln) amidotransferase GatCAB subunit A [Phototrophicales bacterium]RMG74460.1 MAG: Asp-tRNA(Asn)/Glu-tRNA(Gln) amidotransferase subunit GatA [Chloroflexota bacterium]